MRAGDEEMNRRRRRFLESVTRPQNEKADETLSRSTSSRLPEPVEGSGRREAPGVEGYITRNLD